MRVEASGIEIEGVSIAGHESFYKVPAFHALLDFGRAPEDAVSYATVCLTHGHLDHAAGLAHHASRRRLAGLSGARVFAPQEAVPDLEAWIAACERLERVSYGIDLAASRPGDRVTLRRDLELRVLPGRHRVPSVGYLFTEVRHKLVDELAGRPGTEIAALRARGVAVTRRRGDSAPRVYGRLRRRDLRRRAGAVHFEGPSRRMLVPASGRRRSRPRLRPPAPAGLPGSRGPIRERGDRADALLAALLGRRDP